MTALKVVVVSGNLSAPSKTLTLANQIVDAITALVPADVGINQLADLATVFGTARHPGELPEAGNKVLRSVQDADILIAATPVYKGSYTGLFKHVFDFLDPGALVGKAVILAATGGGDKHALVIEHQLRPLFGFFTALTVPSGVYASERDYDGTRFTTASVLERIDAAARQAVQAARSGREQSAPSKAAA